MTKENFRQFCKNRLKKNSKQNLLYDSTWLKFAKSAINQYKNILLYLPLKTEPNSYKLLIYAKRAKKNIFIPKICSSRSFKMVLFRLPLQDGQFNIKTCGNTNNKLIKIELAIVPIIGVDNTFKRIGFGKGYYDRFFGDLKYKPKIVFTQRFFCYSKQEITKSHDINANTVLTAQGFFRKGHIKSVDRVTSNRSINSWNKLCSCKKGRFL